MMRNETVQDIETILQRHPDILNISDVDLNHVDLRGLNDIRKKLKLKKRKIAENAERKIHGIEMEEVILLSHMYDVKKKEMLSSSNEFDDDSIWELESFIYGTVSIFKILDSTPYKLKVIRYSMGSDEIFHEGIKIKSFTMKLPAEFEEKDAIKIGEYAKTVTDGFHFKGLLSPQIQSEIADEIMVVKDSMSDAPSTCSGYNESRFYYGASNNGSSYFVVKLLNKNPITIYTEYDWSRTREESEFYMCNTKKSIKLKDGTDRKTAILKAKKILRENSFAFPFLGD